MGCVPLNLSSSSTHTPPPPVHARLQSHAPRGFAHKPSGHVNKTRYGRNSVPDGACLFFILAEGGTRPAAVDQPFSAKCAVTLYEPSLQPSADTVRPSYAWLRLGWTLICPSDTALFPPDPTLYDGPGRPATHRFPVSPSCSYCRCIYQIQPCIMMPGSTAGLAMSGAAAAGVPRVPQLRPCVLTARSMRAGCWVTVTEAAFLQHFTLPGGLGFQTWFILIGLITLSSKMGRGKRRGCFLRSRQGNASWLRHVRGAFRALRLTGLAGNLTFSIIFSFCQSIFKAVQGQGYTTYRCLRKMGGRTGWHSEYVLAVIF